jgi:hypothetical protein
MTSPARFLLFVILVIAGIKGSEQLYSFVAYRDERAAVRTLRADLVHTGTDLVAVRGRKDTLYAEIKGRDRELERELRHMQGILRANGRTLPPELYERYNAERIRYNLHIDERNARLREWQELDERHLALAGRYNLLADSIHGIAVRMGEPYYQVPSALEAAQERSAEP